MFRNHTQKNKRIRGGSPPPVKRPLISHTLKNTPKPLLKTRRARNEAYSESEIHKLNLQNEKIRAKAVSSIQASAKSNQQFASAKSNQQFASASKTISHVFTSNVLKKYCLDSNICMGFGERRRQIIAYFNNFTGFDYVKSLKMIGHSSNGFIQEIHYKKYNYNAYAILKSATKYEADNLMYEYIVGQFINDKCKEFPCFIQTYGLYYYKTDTGLFFQDKNNDQKINKTILQSALEIQDVPPYDYPKACEDSALIAILIEHIKDAKTLYDMLTNLSISVANKFILYDLLYVLYQVYMPLAQMQDIYTHYDLHIENVILYEPIKGKYIQYYYYLPDETIVSFKSPYIAKIIDYGRSFYEYKDRRSSNNPSKIRKLLCDEPRCTYTDIDNEDEQITCGAASGFKWLNPEFTSNRYYISSSESNPSHDLRLLYSIFGIIKTPEVSDNIKIPPAMSPDNNALLQLKENVFKLIQYGIDENGYPITYPQFGTFPNKTPGYKSGKINNVKDAEEALRNIIMNPDIEAYNAKKYETPGNKIGDMHIYTDGRPMTFDKNAGIIEKPKNRITQLISRFNYRK